MRKDVGRILLQKIKEEGDDSCIDQIGEHGANDGDDEERLVDTEKRAKGKIFESLTLFNLAFVYNLLIFNYICSKISSGDYQN